MAWYRIGTIAVTNGNKTVTGTGTAWVNNVQPGDAFVGPDGAYYEVDVVGSNTSLTLVENYAGTTASGAAYKVIPTQGRVRDLTAQVLQLIQDVGGLESAISVLSGKVGIGTATPVYPLSVVTTGDANALSLGESGSATGKTLDLGYWTATDVGRIQAVHAGTGTKTLALNPSGGSVAIGTAAPLAGFKVDIFSAANNLVLVRSQAGSSAAIELAANGSSPGTDNFSLQQDSGGNALVLQRGNANLTLGTNSAARVVITGEGNTILKLTSAVPSLAAGADAVLTRVSDTQVRLSMRGTDNTTRSVTWTLAPGG